MIGETEYVREPPPKNVQWERCADSLQSWETAVLGVCIRIDKTADRELTASLMYMGEPYASRMEWQPGQPEREIANGLEVLQRSAVLSVWYLKHWWTVDPRSLRKRMRAKPYWPPGLKEPPKRDLDDLPCEWAPQLADGNPKP